MKFDKLDKIHLVGLVLAYGILSTIGRIVDLRSLDDIINNPLGTIVFLGSYIWFLRWWGKMSHWRILRGPLFPSINNKEVR